MSDQDNTKESADASANASGAAPAGQGEESSKATPGADPTGGGAKPATLASAAEYFPAGLEVDIGGGGKVVMKRESDPVFSEVLDTMFAQGLTKEQAEKVSASFVQAANKHDPKPPTDEELSASPIFGGDGPQHLAASKRTRADLVARGLLTQEGLTELENSKALNNPSLVRFFSDLGAVLNDTGGPSPSSANAPPPAVHKTRPEIKETYRLNLLKAGSNRELRIEATRINQAELKAHSPSKDRA